MGGLGNQLFIWALGKSLEQNDSVQFDTTDYNKTNTPRMYMLNQLGIQANLVEGDGRPRQHIIHEGDMRFKPEILESRDVILRGYWQSEKYFKRVEEKIRKEVFYSKNGFSISRKTVLMADKIRSYPNSCFLHVRRSDNLSKRALRFHGMLDGKYYADGLNYIRSRCDDSHFFIFSEDPDWCKQNFSGPDMTIVDHNPFSGVLDDEATIIAKEGGREVEDLWLMTLCKHSIIANSSFSWWGSWLGSKDPSRIITYPAKWFLPPSGPETVDIFPEHWVKLD
jgi:hypothetical protein